MPWHVESWFLSSSGAVKQHEGISGKYNFNQILVILISPFGQSESERDSIDFYVAYQKPYLFFVIARPRFLRSWQSLNKIFKELSNGKAGICLFHEQSLE